MTKLYIYFTWITSLFILLFGNSTQEIYNKLETGDGRPMENEVPTEKVKPVVSGLNGVNKVPNVIQIKSTAQRKTAKPTEKIRIAPATTTKHQHRSSNICKKLRQSSTAGQFDGECGVGSTEHKCSTDRTDKNKLASRQQKSQVGIGILNHSTGWPTKSDFDLRYTTYRMNRYYYCKLANKKVDERVKCFEKEWFEGKEVLDIGCNAGYIALSIATNFNVKRLVGIDIDEYLIKKAKQSLNSLIRLQSAAGSPSNPSTSTIDDDQLVQYPYNVDFRQENYVLETDQLLETIKPEYDTILSFRIIRWIHLNFGDNGLKRYLHRTFLNLRPGGLFIIEPSTWEAYNRRKNTTATTAQVFKTIHFFPDQLQAYLENDVGYTFIERRPILRTKFVLLFKK